MKRVYTPLPFAKSVALDHHLQKAWLEFRSRILSRMTTITNVSEAHVKNNKYNKEEERLWLQRDHQIKNLIGPYFKYSMISFYIEDRRLEITLEENKWIHLNQIEGLAQKLGTNMSHTELYTGSPDYDYCDSIQPGDGPQLIFENVDFSFLNE